MINKIVLLKPHNIIPKDSLKRLLTPLGLLYIAAVLEKEGFEVTIIDSQCEGYENVIEIEKGYIRYGLSDEDLAKRIKEENPDFVAISCPFSDQEQLIMDTCKLVKKIKPDVILALGGIHPSFFPERIMKKCPEADFIVMREGEYRFRDLLKSIMKVKILNTLMELFIEKMKR